MGFIQVIAGLEGENETLKKVTLHSWKENSTGKERAKDMTNENPEIAGGPEVPAH